MGLLSLATERLAGCFCLVFATVVAHLSANVVATPIIPDCHLSRCSSSSLKTRHFLSVGDIPARLDGQSSPLQVVVNQGCTTGEVSVQLGRSGPDGFQNGRRRKFTYDGDCLYVDSRNLTFSGVGRELTIDGNDPEWKYTVSFQFEQDGETVFLTVKGDVDEFPDILLNDQVTTAESGRTFVLRDYLGTERHRRDVSDNTTIDEKTGYRISAVAIMAIVNTSLLYIFLGELAWFIGSINLPHDASMRMRVFFGFVRGGSYLCSCGLTALQDLLVYSTYRIVSGSWLGFRYIPLLWRAAPKSVRSDQIELMRVRTATSVSLETIVEE